MYDLGKQIRLSRIIPEDGKYFGIALDHAIGRGIVSGLDSMEETVRDVVSGKPNSLTIHKGIVERYFAPYAGEVPLVMKLSTFHLYGKKGDYQVTSVDEAVKAGADAVSIGCIVCGENQSEQITMLGNAVRDAHNAGMPIFAHIYPRGGLLTESEMKSAEATAYAVRVGGELGVDLVKTNYTGSPDSFAKVVQTCATRVAVAGGAPGGDLRSYLQMARDAVDVGAVGVTFGRFVIEYKNTPALIKAISALIHDGLSVDQTLEYLETLENE